MRYLKLPVFGALAVLSVAACSRNRGGDDVATGAPAPAPADTAPAARPDPYPSPTPDTTVTVTPTPAPGGTGQLAMGDSVFSGKVGGANCASCHGAEAKGTDLGPDLTDSKWIHGDGSLEFIKTIVRDGVPNPKEHSGAMPSFRGTLSEPQIDAVAAYVRSRNGVTVGSQF